MDTCKQSFVRYQGIMNLFIVEDSLLIQKRLVRFIEEIPGFHVVGVCGDIYEAYQQVKASDTDAMLLDLQLGDQNGLQLLKEVKENLPAIKVVVLTNHSTDDNRTQAMRAGADGFLDKSKDFAQIPDYLLRWQ